LHGNADVYSAWRKNALPSCTAKVYHCSAIAHCPLQAYSLFPQSAFISLNYQLLIAGVTLVWTSSDHRWMQIRTDVSKVRWSMFFRNTSQHRAVWTPEDGAWTHRRT
jgi:hypothetical protein